MRYVLELDDVGEIDVAMEMMQDVVTTAASRANTITILF
jgi:hypothetical protein